MQANMRQTHITQEMEEHLRVAVLLRLRKQLINVLRVVEIGQISQPAHNCGHHHHHEVIVVAPRLDSPIFLQIFHL